MGLTNLSDSLGPMETLKGMSELEESQLTAAVPRS